MALSYRLVLQVTDKALPKVLEEALTNGAKLLSMTPTADSDVEGKSDAMRTRNFSYVEGKRNKGIKGEDLIFEVLDLKGVAIPADFKSAFVKRGFASESYAGTLSKLVTEKKVRSLGESRYCRVGYTISMGAGSSIAKQD